MLKEKARTLWMALRDERGAETGEWIAILALILGVAFLVYPGALGPGLIALTGTIVGALGGIVV